MLSTSMCEPEKVLFTLANNKGYGGFHLTHVVLQGTVLSTETRKNIVPALKQGIAKLGEGVEGIAFIGCLDTKCERMVVIKVARNSLKNEYAILKKISPLSLHVPAAYFYVRCKNRDMMYQEYANGGDLIGFLTKYRTVVQDVHLKTIVFQILWTLYTIQKSVPSFRHNDLHLGNVLLDFNGRAEGGTKYAVGSQMYTVPSVGVRALISDFGWSDMKGAKNRNITADTCQSYGICRDSSKLYDAHFFLNSMLFSLNNMHRPSVTGRLEKFIFDVFGGSQSYMVRESNKIHDYRLRPDANHSGLMSLEAMLAHPYFSSFRKGLSPKILPPAKSPKKKTPPKPKTPPAPAPAPASKHSGCGKRARPVGGVGAERLTTKEMLELIVSKGHAVPKDKSRESLCAVIKQHKLNAPSPVRKVPSPKPVVVKKKSPKKLTTKEMLNLIARKGHVVSNDNLYALIKKYGLNAPTPLPPPAPVVRVPTPPAPVAAQAPASLKAFIKAQGVTVIQPTNEHAWKMKRRKLQEELYDKMNKFNGSTYQNRMNAAGLEAAKMIREMRKK
jgi:hypothetical protein